MSAAEIRADGGGGGTSPSQPHTGHAVNHDLYYNMTLKL
jgi:hypothetical protein